MAGLGDFTDKLISSTYPRVLQLFSGSVVDGTGSFVDLIVSGNLTVLGTLLAPGLTFESASYALSSSYALSASYIPLIAGPNITINPTPVGFEISSSGGNGTTIDINNNISGNILIATGTSSLQGISDFQLKYKNRGSLLNPTFLLGDKASIISSESRFEEIDFFGNTVTYSGSSNKFIFGNGLVSQVNNNAPTYSQFIIGNYNNTGSDYGSSFDNQVVFAVGIGTSDISRSDGLTVKRNGIVTVNSLTATSVIATNFNGTNLTVTSITGSLFGSASYALTSSYTNTAENAISASYLNDPTIVRGGGTGIASQLMYWLDDTVAAPINNFYTDGNFLGVVTLTPTNFITIDAGAAGDMSYGMTITGSLYVTGAVILETPYINTLNKVLINDDGQTVFDWNNGLMYSDTGHEVINLNGSTINDNSNVASIDWLNRTLVNPAGNISLNWSGSTPVLHGIASSSISASYATNSATASVSTTSSYALTASYALNAGSSGITSISKSFGVTLDGGDQTIPSASYGLIHVHGLWTIKGWSVYGNISSSCTVQIQTASFDNYINDQWHTLVLNTPVSLSMNRASASVSSENINIADNTLLRINLSNNFAFQKLHVFIHAAT